MAMRSALFWNRGRSRRCRKNSARTSGQLLVSVSPHKHATRLPADRLLRAWQCARRCSGTADVRGGAERTAQGRLDSFWYPSLLISMQHGYRLIVSFVHGNALGVVLEPRTFAEVPKEQRKDVWKAV